MLTTRQLGSGLEVSALGLGCMGLISWAYGPADEAESLRVLQRALELGVNFWDTAEVYGPFENEALLGRFLKTVPRHNVVIATKFGFEVGAANNLSGVDSRPSNIKRALEGSLERLNTDYIDLYYQHRVDPNVPIEEVMQVLSGFVSEGKIRHIGLSEASAETIRKAHAIHPVSAVQSEYSLWERNVEQSVLPTLKELGIGFVPYSPLGRGFLTGAIADKNKLDPTDWRRHSYPRVSDEVFEWNYVLVQKLKEIAAAHHVTASQIALAWLLRQGDHIVPIPGTKRVRYLEENAAAVDIAKANLPWSELDSFLKSFETRGARYGDAGMKLLDT